jgi:AraC-like DNA-binding protein
MSEFDSRVWIKTDRPLEWLTLARPLPTMELMSVKGSTRLWTEVHTQVCLALITPGQVGVETRWRTRARTLTTGQAGMMLIEPGEVHVTQAVSKAADFEVVRFVPAVFEEARRELGLRGEFHFRAPTGDNPRVTRAVAELGQAHARGDSNLELASLSTELVSLMLSELSEQPSNVGVALDPVRDFRLRQAREYLRSQLDDKPSLDELAAELKISKYRLCAIFKAAYGVSVGQYWMAARMAEASRSLLLGVPIKHVAAQLGFVDEAFFTRVFRRHRGLPPAAWVRLQRQNSPRAPGQPLRSETRGAA